MQSTGELFLSHSTTKLTQMTGHIAACLEKLTLDQIWNRASDTQNAVGNLVLHLCGNVRQWIGWSIGSRPDIRKRDDEFSSSGIAKQTLLESLTATVNDAVAILEKLPPDRLTDRVPTQDGELTILEVIYQVVGHFQQHTGQIIYATKLLTGEDLKFYQMKTQCSGCGLPDSEECQNLFNELSAYTLTRGDREFIHQHAVDAYGAQHVGGAPSNIRLAFSLIGLYLTFEKGYTGRQVQLAHMRLGRKKRQWPAHTPPVQHAKLTVADVMAANPGTPRDEMLLKWAAAVWDSWVSIQPWTRETVAELL